MNKPIANCGCVYHAEQDIMCEHDLRLQRLRGLIDALINAELPLDPVAIEEWADSLKNYDQCKEYLYYEGAYCCLGVLAKEAGELVGGVCRKHPTCIGDNGVRLMKLIGENSLSSLNDSGKTFDYVASKLRQAAIKLYDWHGHTIYGNYGDGKWRVAPPANSQGNVIEPANTIREAHERLLKTL